MIVDRVFRWSLVTFLWIIILGYMFSELNIAYWENIELLEAISNLGIAIGAILTPIAAFKGLSTWKRQLDSDLARRLAAAVFQHRKSLLAITYPDVSIEERNLDGAPEPPHGPNYVVYWYRFGKTKKHLADVETLLAEAELRWGAKVVQSYEPVAAVGLELMRKILATEETRYATPRDAIQGRDDAENYLLDLAYKQKCEAAVSINAAFEQIQTALKGKV